MSTRTLAICSLLSLITLSALTAALLSLNERDDWRRQWGALSLAHDTLLDERRNTTATVDWLWWSKLELDKSYRMLQQEHQATQLQYDDRLRVAQALVAKEQADVQRLDDENTTLRRALRASETDAEQLRKRVSSLIQLVKDVRGDIDVAQIQYSKGFLLSRDTSAVTRVNNETAGDPTLQSLRSFLGGNDDVDAVCVHDSAEQAGIRAAVVVIGFADTPLKYRANAFYLKDRKAIIYTSSMRFPIVQGRSITYVEDDQEVSLLEIGKPLKFTSMGGVGRGWSGVTLSTAPLSIPYQEESPGNVASVEIHW